MARLARDGGPAAAGHSARDGHDRGQQFPAASDMRSFGPFAGAERPCRARHARAEAETVSGPDITDLGLSMGKKGRLPRILPFITQLKHILATYCN